MISIIAYAVGIAGVLWYTLFYLPYEEITRNFGFALNIVQWGIVSLLSFLVYRQEKHYRSIFFQFWIFFAMLSLSAPIVYHFDHWYPPNGGVLAYVLCGAIINRIWVAWIVVNILFTYLFRDEKRWAVNSLTALVVLPLCLWLFWPYWWSPATVLSVTEAGQAVANYRPIEISIIWVNCFSLAALLAFFLHKLKTDKPIGAYADTLLFFFSLMLAVDTAEYLSNVTEIKFLVLSQWSLSIIAASMIITLMLRLKFKSQRIADYYESQCISDNPDIDRRVGSFDRLIIWCFFDSEKVGKKVFLGTGRKKMSVRRTPSRVSRTVHAR
jgi:hypothetical protein